MESNMGQTLAEEESLQGRNMNPSSISHGGCDSGCGQQQHHSQMPPSMLLHALQQHGHKLPSDWPQQQNLLANLSHLHLNGLQLTQLHSLRACPKLQVLYIYDNLLTSIDSLASSRLLTHIYCHNNQLTSLQGVQHLPLLQKLYAQGNCLSAVDCLTHAHHLEELHVSNQQHWAAPQAAAAGCASSSQHLLQPHHDHQQGARHAEPVLDSWAPAAAAGHKQQQQATQQHDELVLLNDGCQVEHCLTSSPPTPPPADQDSSSGAVIHQPSPLPAAVTAAAHSAAVEALAGPGTSNSSRPCSRSSMPPSGLWFDPASLSAISGSLRVLTAAGCAITDPRPLAVLSGLQVLDLASNAIASLVLLQPVLEALGRLRDLDLRNNPSTHSSSSSSKYRDSIILAAAGSLEQLDGQEVRPAHRAFLHSRKARARQHHHAALQEHQQEQQQLLLHLKELQVSKQASAMHDASEAEVAQQAAFHIQSKGGPDGWGVAAGTRLSPRGRQLGRQGLGCEALAAAGPTVSGLRLQLPVVLQACRPARVRAPAVGGFRLSPRKAGKERPAAGGGRPSGTP